MAGRWFFAPNVAGSEAPGIPALPSRRVHASPAARRGSEAQPDAIARVVTVLAAAIGAVNLESVGRDPIGDRPAVLALTRPPVRSHRMARFWSPWSGLRPAPRSRKRGHRFLRSGFPAREGACPLTGSGGQPKRRVKRRKWGENHRPQYLVCRIRSHHNILWYDGVGFFHGTVFA